MILERVGLLAVDSGRTRAYLAALLKHDLLPSAAILLTEAGPGQRNIPPVPYFDNLTPALETIQTAGIPCEIVETGDVNSDELIAAVERCPVDFLIYSGAGGAILRRGLFETGKRFLHIHPGLVPQYRGSTPFYYSLLVDDTCGTSAMFLDEQIDTGPVLARRSYPPPADRTTIDHGYDPFIRSDMLVRVLREYTETGRFNIQSQQGEEGETYYIMHPVLRHIAILSNRAVQGGQKHK